MSNKLSYSHLSDKQELTEEFVVNNADILDWTYVSHKMDIKNFSYEFFQRFKPQLEWEILGFFNQSMTTKFAHDHEEELGFLGYYKDGRLHRTNGPAIKTNRRVEYDIFIKTDPNKEKEKLEFRMDRNGECWFNNGIIHKTDGKAAIFKDGNSYWGINNKIMLLSQQIELRRLKPKEIEKLLNTFLDDFDAVKLDPALIRELIAQHIKSKLHYKYEVEWGGPGNIMLGIRCEGINIFFRISVKNTGEEKRVGNKIKKFKGKGKIKFENAKFNFVQLPHFSLEKVKTPWYKKNKLELTAGNNTITRRGVVTYTREDELTIEQMIKKSSIDERINREELREEIIDMMIQPMIMSAHGLVGRPKNIFIPFARLPRPIKKVLPTVVNVNDMYTMFFAACEEVYEERINNIYDTVYQAPIPDYVFL